MNKLQVSGRQFVLFSTTGLASLGDEIEVVMRRLLPIKITVREATHIRYLVEVTKSKWHVTGQQFDTNNLCIFEVPLRTADSRIAMTVFREGAFGQTHRLSLVPYKVGGEAGHTLAIGGLLWDGKIIHVKDIAA